jgi:hypothetical protein
VEIGWIAWGVGVLAGLGAKFGAEGTAGKEVGVAAAVVALAGIALGKLAAVSLAVSGAISGGLSEEFLISYVADVVAEESAAEGHEFSWPSRDTEYPERAEHYPRDVWSEAERRWADTPARDRESFRAELLQEREAMAGEVMKAGFFESWAAMDLLFVLLAVSSAFKIAQGTPVRLT